MSDEKWQRSSLRHLSTELTQAGYPIRSLLKKWLTSDPPQRGENRVKIRQYTKEERHHAWKTQTAAQLF